MAAEAALNALQGNSDILSHVQKSYNKYDRAIYCL